VGVDVGGGRRFGEESKQGRLFARGRGRGGFLGSHGRKRQDGCRRSERELASGSRTRCWPDNFARAFRWDEDMFEKLRLRSWVEFAILSARGLALGSSDPRAATMIFERRTPMPIKLNRKSSQARDAPQGRSCTSVA
jgi:hypothetical protein